MMGLTLEAKLMFFMALAIIRIWVLAISFKGMPRRIAMESIPQKKGGIFLPPCDVTRLWGSEIIPHLAARFSGGVK
jgi:hypothetical protein